MSKEIKVHAPADFGQSLSGRRSWVDMLHEKVDQLKLNRWLVYLGAALVMITFLNGLHWLSGALPVGQFTGPLLFTASVTVLSIAFAHYLDLIALDSLERFRGALTADEAEFKQLAYNLTTMPAIPVLLCQLCAVPLFIAIIRFDPTFCGLLRGHPLSDVALYVIGLINYGILMVNLYHTVHQLLWVQAVHARAHAISVIDRAPAFAFSKLTYWTAVLGMVLVYGFIYFFPALRRDPLAVSLAVGTALLLVVTFFLPLQEMHNRLVEDKEGRLRAVRQLIEAAFASLHSARQEVNFAEAEETGKHLSALIAEEEYLSKLPTWPWPAGTVTKLMSVALLPLLLIIAERYLGQYIP
jgi:hypothetical protein